MFAATVKNGKTRLYLTDGTRPASILGRSPSEFWRTDNANQPAAALLASEAAGRDRAAGYGIPVPGAPTTAGSS